MKEDIYSGGKRVKFIKRYLIRALRYSVLETKDKVCKQCYPRCDLCRFYIEGKHGCLPLDVWKGLIDLGYKL